MCMLCVEWEKRKITTKEAFGAIGEMLSATKDAKQIKHLTDLSNKILDEEVPFADIDADLDASWEEETRK